MLKEKLMAMGWLILKHQIFKYLQGGWREINVGSNLKNLKETLIASRLRVSSHEVKCLPSGCDGVLEQAAQRLSRRDWVSPRVTWTGLTADPAFNRRVH